MVAKGLNFDDVTLVGVVDADMSLYVDHFRAAETTFDLVTQVVGRAGRGAKRGIALIQTFTPKNEVLLRASRQDYDGFFEAELSRRRLTDTPPFADLIQFGFTGFPESHVERCAAAFAGDLWQRLQDPRLRPAIRDLLGPAPAPIMKINEKYRFRLTLVCKTAARSGRGSLRPCRTSPAAGRPTASASGSISTDTNRGITMALRKILTFENEALKKVCRPVTSFDARLGVLLDDMKETLTQANGVGLAAPQVGILRRVVVVDTGEDMLELINPKILETSGEQDGLEGCLSVPDRFGMVKRPNYVKLEAQDRNGEWFEYEAEGLIARCFCHETEHLDGHIFTEKAYHMLTDEEYERLMNGEGADK